MKYLDGVIMYTLDVDAARSASGMPKKISEIGKYKGTISYARDVKSKKGTSGVEIKFISNDGQDAVFTLWTYSAKSETLVGYKQLNSLMTCAKVKGLSLSAGKVAIWDWDSRSELESEEKVFKELHGKKIGILFETEDYERADGQIRSKVYPAHFFEAETELTASEILDKKVSPERLPKLVASLKHRPIKGAVIKNTAFAKDELLGSLEDEDIPF